MSKRVEEAFYENVFAAIGAIVMVIDANGCILRMNETAEHLMGCQTKEIKEQPFFWERFIPMEERARVIGIFDSMKRRALPREVEYHWISRSGECRLFNWINTILDDEDGNPAFLITVGMDITEKKRLETSLNHSRDFHTLLSHANEVIAQAIDEKVLLQQICDLAITNTKLGVVWIGQPDEQGWFHYQATAGEIDFLDGLRISNREYFPEGNGSVGRAWRAEQPVFYHSIMNNPTMTPWRDRIEKLGLKSSAALPIFRKEKIWGILAVYHIEEEVFNDDLQKILIDLAQDIGYGLERLDLEMQKRQANQLNDILLNSLNAGVAIVRYPERKLEWVNQGIVDIYGARSSADIIEKITRNIYPDETIAQRIEVLAKYVLRNGKGKLSDILNRRFDGTSIYVDVFGQNYVRGDGVDRIIWTYIDVTDRHQHEQQIRELSKQKSLLLDNTIAGLDVVRYPERVITEANQRFVELMGYKRLEEVIGMPTFKVYPNEHEYKRMDELSHTVLAQGQGFLRDIIVQNPDGKQRYLDIEGKLLSSEDDHTSIIWTSVDVTERHHLMENWMQEARIRLNLINNTAIGIILVNRDRTIIRANRRILDLLGYEEEEIIGKSTRVFFDSDEQYQHFEYFYDQLMASQNGMVTMQFTYQKKDGTPLVADITGAWLDPADPSQGIIGTMQDISEKLALEKVVKESNERMRHELVLASHLQRAFLPQSLPDLRGIDIAWEYIPSDYLAGDMINLMMVDDNHLAFYLLDVMGHGVSAALQAFAINYFIRSFGTADEMGNFFHPGDLLTELNLKFSDFYLTESYFTIFYGVLDLSTNRLIYAKGGHPAPFLLHKNGAVESLDQGEMPLGIRKETRYQDYQVFLQAGDELLLFSDGLTEMMNDQNEMFSIQRVRDLMIKNKDENIHYLLANLLDHLNRFSGETKWNDDVTLIGLKISE